LVSDSELVCWLWHCAATAVALKRHERTNAFNLVLFIFLFFLSGDIELIPGLSNFTLCIFLTFDLSYIPFTLLPYLDLLTCTTLICSVSLKYWIKPLLLNLLTEPILITPMHILSASKMFPSDKSFMQNHWGSPKTKRHTGEWNLQISHLLFTEVYKINNIQEYQIYCCHLKSKHMFNVRSRQKMTEMGIVNGLQLNA